MTEKRAELAARLGGLRRRLRWSHLLFLSNFGVSKLLTYVAPLGIALVAAADVYGALELSQSLGLLLATFVVGPGAQGLTQQLLVERNTEYAGASWLLVGGFALLSLAVLIVGRALGLSPELQLVAASLGAAGLHVVGNSTALMLGQRNISVWTAGTNILVAGMLVGLLLVALGTVTIEGLTWAYALINVVLLAATGAALVRFPPTNAWRRTAAASAVGLPMILVAGLAMWLSVGGRITVGAFNTSALPIYGVAFRIGGLLLGFHQLAMTVFFVTMYRGRIAQSDRIMAAFMGPILAAGIVVSLLGRPIATVFDSGALAGETQVDTFVHILPLTVLHTYFWIAQAMLQMRINRYRLATRALVPNAIGTLAGIAIIAAVAQWISRDVELLCWLLALHAAVLYAVNSLILRSRRLPHKGIDLMTGAGGIILALGAAIVDLH